MLPMPLGATILLAAQLSLFASPLTAQWIHYPTAGVPRLDGKPSGKPDLASASPRAADGRPDLSGIWAPEKNRPCPPEGCDDMQIPYEFLDIGWSLPGGLPYQPWAAALMKSRKALAGIQDPTTHCLPGSVVKFYTTPLLHKIVQTPGLLLLLAERDAAYRQIFTDGPLPSDPQPSWNGYSTGKWDSDTLVVETNGFRDGLWLDRNGSPMTDAARMIERFHRVNYGKLEIEITVDDPKAYTRPWTVKLTQLIVLDTELLDYICLENEKDARHLLTK
jgi:hypothetical protein